MASDASASDGDLGRACGVRVQPELRIRADQAAVKQQDGVGIGQAGPFEGVDGAGQQEDGFAQAAGQGVAGGLPHDRRDPRGQRMFCPRSIHLWWREIWLERVPKDILPSATRLSTQVTRVAAVS